MNSHKAEKDRSREKQRSKFPQGNIKSSRNVKVIYGVNKKTSNWVDKIPPIEFDSRNQLPSRSISNSIFTLPKNYIGKDLTRVSLPITFNEPLTYLQRISECMTYVYLIQQALKTKNPVERMEFIATFALSTLTTHSSQLLLPFKSLLHETFELSQSQLGFEFIAEQVSADPPISAFYARGGNEYEFYGNIEPRIKFWGQSLENSPNSIFTIHLKKFNETYVWRGVSCSVYKTENGNVCISLNETMKIKCLESDVRALIQSTSASGGGGNIQIRGEIFRGKTSVRILYGFLTHYIASTSTAIYQELKDQWKKENKTLEKNGNNDTMNLFYDSSLLWKILPKLPDSKHYYDLSIFALMLNEMLFCNPSKLLKTDSRFRPDIILMEAGNFDLIAAEKERLEEKQRTKLRSSEFLQPRWFSLEKLGSGEKSNFYAFNGKFFNRDFSKRDDIY